MSARRLDSAPLGLSSRSTQCLTLRSTAVQIHKNGIEFHNHEPIAIWTEMTVSLQGPTPAKKVNFTGVIVACKGDRQNGYTISMLFTHVTRLSQARLLGYS